MEPLKNTYLLLRHGQSLANVAGLIVSDPENGVNGYGLSDLGTIQVQAAFAKPMPGLDHTTLVVSSDFLRARQTATIAAEALGCAQGVHLTPLLRERFFGDWELTSARNYEKVWADDALEKTANGVEKVTSVLNRGLDCLKALEQAHGGRSILLVSHGDTLQILMTHFKGISPFCHRTLDHLEVAEVRQLAPGPV